MSTAPYPCLVSRGGNVCASSSSSRTTHNPSAPSKPQPNNPLEHLLQNVKNREDDTAPAAEVRSTRYLLTHNGYSLLTPPSQNRGRPILRGSPTAPCDRRALCEAIELDSCDRHTILRRTGTAESRTRRLRRRPLPLHARCV